LLRKPPHGIALNKHIVFYQQACQLGCEGIVSKRPGSAYRSGRSKQMDQGQEPGSPGEAEVSGVG
jgi:hypothetical protein